MNNCWYKLKVDCPVINSQWNFPTPNNISIRLKANIKSWDKIVEMFQILNLLSKR